MDIQSSTFSEFVGVWGRKQTLEESKKACREEKVQSTVARDIKPSWTTQVYSSSFKLLKKRSHS
jgi:hypothetical protein